VTVARAPRTVERARIAKMIVSALIVMVRPPPPP
jgi:hypothetical protein